MRKGPPAAPAQPIGPSGLCPEADRGRPAGAARRRPIASSIDAWWSTRCRRDRARYFWPAW